MKGQVILRRNVITFCAFERECPFKQLVAKKIHINLKLDTRSVLGKIVVIPKSIIQKRYYQDEQKKGN